MTKFVDSLGLKRLITNIAEAVTNGTWLPVMKGEGKGSVAMGAGEATGEFSYSQGTGSQASGNNSHAECFQTSASGDYSHAEGSFTTASGDASHSEGDQTNANGDTSHAEGYATTANGYGSHAEGNKTTASSDFSHTEGDSTTASGFASHAQGSSNYDDPSFIDVVGVGNDNTTKNASVIYVKRDIDGYPDPSDPKTGYQYLIGIGGYQGRNIAEGMKSVQEVITDLEKGVAATETMTVEEIREIMSA